MITLTPDDINAIADAVAARLRGDSMPMKQETGVSATKKMQLRELAIAAVNGGKKGRTKSATTTVSTGQPKATRTTTGV